MGKTRLNWGEPPWHRGVDLEIGSLAIPPKPDVVVIGAGLTGASAALHLAKRGTRVVVCEAGLVADGASGRTGGLVLEGTAVGPLEDVESCVPGLERIVTEEHIDCDLSLPGCWEIEHHASAPEKMLPWTDAGRPVCITRTVRGGVVQPAALTIGLAQAAVRAGAIIREQARVTRIVFEPELSVEIGSDRITPGHVVIATNAWINTTVPGVRRLSSSLTFACATAPLDTSALDAIGLAGGVPFYTTDTPYLWGRTILDGRVIFGSGLVFGSPSDLEASDVRQGDSLTALERLRRRVRALHPRLADVRFSAAWGGPIAFAEDAVPILGPHPRNPRVLVSGGYAGHGVALSVRAGELTALAIAENRPLPKWGSLTRTALRD
jgi:gamma-glutamylputrescine oxidase